MSVHFLIGILILSSVTMLSLAAEERDAFVYVLGFMNISMDQALDGYQEIFVTSQEETIARIEIPFIGLDEYFSLSASNNFIWSRKIDIDLSTAKNDGVRRKGVRITSTHALDIQAVKSKEATTDGFLALPITETATEFFVTSAGVRPGEHSAFVVAAVFPNTCLEAYMVIGDTYRKLRGLIQLQEFDIYQLESDSIDLTGIYINSTKPIAVFGGHECAEEPLYTRFCDHTVAQVPPVSEWGTQFNVPPIEGRDPAAGYTLRIVAASEDTYVYLNGDTYSEILRRGQYAHVNISDSRSATLVTCSKPCLVTQHNRSWKFVENDVQTDSFVTLIPPIDHYVTATRFRTARFFKDGRGNEYQQNYVAVVVPLSHTGRVMLDNQPFNPFWRNYGNGFSVGTLQVDAGYHGVSMVSDDVTIGIMTYTYGHAVILPTGYGYPGGYKVFGNIVRGPWNYFFTTTDKPLGPCNRYIGRPEDARFRFGVTIDLREEVTSQCAVEHQIMLKAKLAEVIKKVNENVCHELLCPELLGNAAITYNSDWSQEEFSSPILDIDILLVASLDSTPRDLHSCRKAVLDVISSQPTWWGLPQTIPQCPTLDFRSLRAKDFGKENGRKSSPIDWQCQNLGM